MSDALRLRQYYEGLSDAELIESHAAGPGHYEPEAWTVIGEQMTVRQLDGSSLPATKAPAIVHANISTLSFIMGARKRVEEGGSVAFVMAIVFAFLGVDLIHLNYRWLPLLPLFTISVAYAFAGRLMRREHSVWAASACLIFTVFFAWRTIVLARRYPGMYLVLLVFLYAPPIYWFWRAYRAARALKSADAAIGNEPAPL